MIVKFKAPKPNRTMTKYFAHILTLKVPTNKQSEILISVILILPQFYPNLMQIGSKLFHSFGLDNI
jgi:hypothetical protein